MDEMTRMQSFFARLLVLLAALPFGARVLIGAGFIGIRGAARTGYQRIATARGER